MSLAALCAWTLAVQAGSAGTPATAGEAVVELRQAQLRGVRAERTRRFLTAWEASDDERRALLAAQLRGPSGAPLGSRPELEQLARWTRRLDAGEQADDPLVLLAEALDLRVVPGAFEPSSATDERGTPLVVHAARLFPLPPPSMGGEVALELEWIAPDGTRTHARREPFAVGLFRPPGVPLYLRAPVTADEGLWRLQPTLVREGRAVRGAAVPVPCASLLAIEGAAELLTEGLRPIGLADWSPSRSDAPGGRPRSWPDGPFDERLAPVLLEAADQDDGAHDGGRPSVVVLAPRGEASAALFAPPCAEPWRRLVAADARRVVSIELAPGEGALLAASLASLRALEPGRAVVLVARGDAMASLAAASARGLAGVDRLALVGTRVLVPPALAALPLLVVARALPGELVGRDDVRWVEHDLPQELLLEPRLPAILSPWLRAEGAPEGAR